MHDIYYGTQLPPHRKPIPIDRHPATASATHYLRCDPNKIVAIVETNAPDRNSAFTRAGRDFTAIAGHILEFLAHEVKKGRLPENLLPLQSGVGNVANAVMAGLQRRPVREPDRLYRSAAGRHARLHQVRQAALRLGDRAVAEPGGCDEFNRDIDILPRAASSCGRRKSPTIRK